MKQNWKEQNIEIKSLKEINIEVLGKFVQGLTMDDLKELPSDVKLVAFKKLGEFTGLPEDKLKARANFAFEYFEVSLLNSYNYNLIIFIF